jgi:hypothetical protein
MMVADAGVTLIVGQQVTLTITIPAVLTRINRSSRARGAAFAGRTCQ